MSAVQEANRLPSGYDFQVFIDAWTHMSILTAENGASHDDRLSCSRVRNWIEGVIRRSRGLDEIIDQFTPRAD